jgi:hypothetical protein
MLIHTVSSFHNFYAVILRKSPSIMLVSRTALPAGTPHIFCVTTTSIPWAFVRQYAPDDRSNSRWYTRTRHFTTFMPLSTSATVFQSLSYAGLKSTQVPHTYSVSQPLASHVYSCRNDLPKIAQIDVYTHDLDISLLLSPQLPPKSFNDRDMPDSSSHWYPAHILSHNHWHTMSIGEAIGIRESLKTMLIHTVSTFHYLYPLNFRQNPSIIEICRNQV